MGSDCMRVALVILALAGCGSSKPATTNEPATTAASSGDDCEQYVAKVRFIVDEMMQQQGRNATDEEIKFLVEHCRDPGTKQRSSKLMACVLAAKDQPAVRTCLDEDVGDGQPKDTRPEAERYLSRLAKNATTMFQATAQFTIGKAGPTPAAKCGCPTACRVDTDLWMNDPIWGDIELVVNEDSQYQYTYESDGKTFKATAIGDLDCDGKPGVWTLTGASSDSGATTTITPPPKGAR